MKRVASVIGLPPENRAEYERYHAAVWPGVLARLAARDLPSWVLGEITPGTGRAALRGQHPA